MEESDSSDSFNVLQQEMELDEQVLQTVMDDSSDEEEAKAVMSNREGKSPNEKRDFLKACNTVIAHHFMGRDSVFNKFKFERRFRMPRSIFNRVHDHVMGMDPFILKKDAAKKQGTFPLVKLVGCFRYLACGDGYDRDDENLHIAETTMREIVKEFCRLVIKECSSQHLNRAPTETEKKVIL